MGNSRQILDWHKILDGVPPDRVISKQGARVPAVYVKENVAVELAGMVAGETLLTTPPPEATVMPSVAAEVLPLVMVPLMRYVCCPVGSSGPHSTLVISALQGQMGNSRQILDWHKILDGVPPDRVISKQGARVPAVYVKENVAVELAGMVAGETLLTTPPPEATVMPSVAAEVLPLVMVPLMRYVCCPVGSSGPHSTLVISALQQMGKSRQILDSHNTILGRTPLESVMLKQGLTGGPDGAVYVKENELPVELAGTVAGEILLTDPPPTVMSSVAAEVLLLLMVPLTIYVCCPLTSGPHSTLVISALQQMGNSRQILDSHNTTTFGDTPLESVMLKQGLTGGPNGGVYVKVNELPVGVAGMVAGEILLTVPPPGATVIPSVAAEVLLLLMVPLTRYVCCPLTIGPHTILVISALQGTGGHAAS